MIGAFKLGAVAAAISKETEIPAEVVFVAGADSVYSVSTSLAASAPAGIQDGDALIAIVFTRSAMVPPAGWTLIHESEEFQANDGTKQRLAAFRKDVVTAADSGQSFTWGQEVSARIGVAYAVARSSTGLFGFVAASTTISNNANDKITPPVLTAGSNPELFIIAATVVGVNPTADELTPPPGWTGFAGLITRPDNRLGAAYRVMAPGESNSGVYDVTRASSTTNGIGALTLRVVPLYEEP